MIRIALIGMLLGLFAKVNATHNRAGEITVEQISGNQYKITVTTYTSTLTGVDRDSLVVSWGDGSFGIIERTSEVLLPNDYKHNTYEGFHEYPGTGVYEIVMEDPNRNPDIVNIPNSVFTVFSLKTTLNIDLTTGNINTPVLLNPPYDRAGLGHPFIHNPAAFDPDGDSISYELTVCRADNGDPIENYSFPEASDTLLVNPVNGDLLWNAPVETGKFNIAMQIYEWRNGIIISSIVRDMQIDVEEADNNPPINNALQDFCVVAGDSVTLTVSATDADNDFVQQIFTGGPFILDNAPEIDSVTAEAGYVEHVFRWKTNSDHIRKYPYQIIVKADDQNPLLNLVDIDHFYITVTAPPPDTVWIEDGFENITIHWSQVTEGPVSGYYVYRSPQSVPLTVDSCAPGLADDSRFERIATIQEIGNTVFSDTTVESGFEYCYRITAFYGDGAESQPTKEVCGQIKPGEPAILQASVLTDDENNGSILLAWAFPELADAALDASVDKEYRIYRWFGAPTNKNEIAVIPSNDLTDTIFTDTGLNTLDFPYNYQVIIFYDSAGVMVPYYDGNDPVSVETVQTLYATVEASDNTLFHRIQKQSPWIDTVYQFNRGLSPDNISTNAGATTIRQFKDSTLTNNTTYYYKITSHGWRRVYNKEFITSNVSHIISGKPVDTVAPCQPEIFDLTSDCDALTNRFLWRMPFDSCYNDVVHYNVYYAPNLETPFETIESVWDPAQRAYNHFIDTSRLAVAGCYAVTAVDSFGNESNISKRVCIDSCTYYKLPNVFAPGNDGIMDYYVADNPYNTVKRVEMQIFNRWGQLVYKTENPDIRWDGINTFSNKMVTSGVYFYVCVVYENRVSGLEDRTLTGFIHVYPDIENF